MHKRCIIKVLSCSMEFNSSEYERIRHRPTRNIINARSVYRKEILIAFL